MPTKADILRSYRELVYLIRRLPEGSNRAALTEARQEIYKNKDVQDETKLTELHKILTSKIGFLRLSQPRRAGDKYAKAGKFVLRDGKLTEQAAQRELRFVLSPEACAGHFV